MADAVIASPGPAAAPATETNRGSDNLAPSFNDGEGPNLLDENSVETIAPSQARPSIPAKEAGERTEPETVAGTDAAKVETVDPAKALLDYHLPKKNGDTKPGEETKPETIAESTSVFKKLEALPVEKVTEALASLGFDAKEVSQIINANKLAGRLGYETGQLRKSADRVTKIETAFGETVRFDPQTGEVTEFDGIKLLEQATKELGKDRVLESLKPVGLTIAPIAYIKSLEAKSNGNGLGSREKILREIATKHKVENADTLDYRVLRAMLKTDPDLAEADDEFSDRVRQVEQEHQQQQQTEQETERQNKDRQYGAVAKQLEKYAKDIPHYAKLEPVIAERAKKLYDGNGQINHSEVTELLKDAADLSHLRSVIPEILAAANKQAVKAAAKRWGIPENLIEEPSAAQVAALKLKPAKPEFDNDLEGSGPDLLSEG